MIRVHTVRVVHRKWNICIRDRYAEVVDFGPKHFAQHPDRQVGRWYGRSARGSGKCRVCLDSYAWCHNRTFSQPQPERQRWALRMLFDI
jgi:hypothetical protein